MRPAPRIIERNMRPRRMGSKAGDRAAISPRVDEPESAGSVFIRSALQSYRHRRAASPGLRLRDDSFLITSALTAAAPGPAGRARRRFTSMKARGPRDHLPAGLGVGKSFTPCSPHPVYSTPGGLRQGRGRSPLFAAETSSPDLSDSPSLWADYLVECDAGRSRIRNAGGNESARGNSAVSHRIAEADAAEKPEWAHPATRTGSIPRADAR